VLGLHRSREMTTNPVKISPKGTPFSDPAHLSIVSYNILAPIYVRPIDSRTGSVQDFAAFEWAEPAEEVLEWDARRPRILAELKSFNADIVCLQEVQFVKANDGRFTLPPWLRDLDGYEARIPQQMRLSEMADRNERVLGTPTAVGNALLLRRSRVEMVPCALPESQTTRVPVVVQGKRGTSLSHLRPTMVYCVHLDATSEEKRVKTISRSIWPVFRIDTHTLCLVNSLWNKQTKTNGCFEWEL